MAVTRLKRKHRKNIARANNKQRVIKQLLATPVIKNVDVEELKAQFKTNPNAGVVNQVKEAVADAAHTVAEKVENVADNVKEQVDATVEPVAESGSSLFNTVKEAISGAAHTVADKVEDVVEAVKDRVDNVIHTDKEEEKAAE